MSSSAIGDSSVGELAIGESLPIPVEITVTPDLPAVGLIQTHKLSVTDLTIAPNLPATSVKQTHKMGAATPLTVTPDLPATGLRLKQSIGVTDLTIVPTLPAVGIKQTHSIGATALTVVPTLPAVDLITRHRIGSTPLTVTPDLPAVGLIQTHKLGVTPLTVTPWLEVRDIVYLGFSYSPENKAITNYENFNFQGSCFFNGKTLLFNDSGLFEYGGVSDNGNAIVASIKTGKMNGIMGRGGVYPSTRIKRIPDAKVNVDCDKVGGSVTLNVIADDQTTYSYVNAISHSGFATHRVPIGRGIKFNYVQFEVIGTSCSKIDISSIEYNPVENVRSER